MQDLLCTTINQQSPGRFCAVFKPPSTAPNPPISLDDGDDLVDAFETQWYKGVKKKMTPGTYLRIYRENKGLTQLQLGEVLGGIPRQHISNMEHGSRSISLKTARKISSLFGAPIEKFIAAHEE